MINDVNLADPTWLAPISSQLYVHPARSDAQTQSTAVTDAAGTSYPVPVGDCAVLSLAVSVVLPVSDCAVLSLTACTASGSRKRG